MSEWVLQGHLGGLTLSLYPDRAARGLPGGLGAVTNLFCYYRNRGWQMTLLGVPEVTEPMSNPPRRHSPFPGRQVGKGHQPLETHSSLLICFVVLAVAGQPCNICIRKTRALGRGSTSESALKCFLFSEEEEGQLKGVIYKEIFKSYPQGGLHHSYIWVFLSFSFLSFFFSLLFSSLFFFLSFIFSSFLCYWLG